MVKPPILTGRTHEPSPKAPRTPVHPFSAIRGLFRLLLVSLLAVAPLAAQTGPVPQAISAAPDNSAPRAAALVRQMTLDEKVAQLQNAAPAIPRLGIPEYDWWNEALHGVARSGYATVFPQAIGMAATWDRELLGRIGDAISTEARAKFNQAQREGNRSINFGLTMWSPNINIDRDPRWGRGQETYGEDPLLTGTLAAAYVRGLQGPDPLAPKVDATAKHFAVHSGPEAVRHTFNVNVSAHDLYDTYLPAFRQLVVDARVNAVMCAYNSVDGKPACASDLLLDKVLHREWGFNGYVVSDCAAITDVADGHRFAPDLAHAAAAALHAGTDLSCGKEFSSLADAVRKGLVQESEIDAALTRLLAARIRLGLIGSGNAAGNAIPASANDSPQHAQLALEAARGSIVLLKNERNTLPLSNSIHTIAVVGPNARSLAALEGNYNAVPSHPSFPLEAIEARAHVIYAQGAPLVEGFDLPVPLTAFSTTAGGQPVQGLTAEYFSGAGFNAKPQLRRIDRAIDFDWNAAAPDPSITPNAFAVRWSGSIAMPTPGTFSFGFEMAHCSTCDDAETVRVWLDGKPVYNYVHAATHGRRAPTPRFKLTFADTRSHPLRVEYMHSAPHFGAGLSMNWLPPIAALRDEALRAAQKADAVVAFLGLSPELEGEEMPVRIDGFEGGDRTSIELPRTQAALVQALASTGKPLVVVLMSGSALALGDSAAKMDALLEAWYPGQAGGQAIADTLFGDSSPSGRLPVTFYAATGQLPPFADYSMHNRTYRYFAGQPAFGFGFGLSYAHFTYANAQLAGTLMAAEPITVRADVTNTSARAADEVVECYLIPQPGPDVPLRKLVGFAKVHLDAGQTRTVSLALDARALSLVDAAGNRHVEPGASTLFLGGGQPGQGSGVEVSLHVEHAIDLAP
jgi:beta-glucosidase